MTARPYAHTWEQGRSNAGAAAGSTQVRVSGAPRSVGSAAIDPWRRAAGTRALSAAARCLSLPGQVPRSPGDAPSAHSTPGPPSVLTLAPHSRPAHGANSKVSNSTVRCSRRNQLKLNTNIQHTNSRKS